MSRIKWPSMFTGLHLDSWKAHAADMKLLKLESVFLKNAETRKPIPCFECDHYNMKGLEYFKDDQY